MAAPQVLAESENLDRLYSLLSPLSMGAGWNKPTPSLWPAPNGDFLPARWAYSQAKGALDAAGRLIDTKLAERRNLILVNPHENNSYATTRTMTAAYQMILPGEKARSHRHTPNALRLVMDTEPGIYTVVDGAKLPMLPGDVLLTPNWCWHGHSNDSGARAYWIDFLDTPLVHLLEPMFLEPHPDEFEEPRETPANSTMRFPWEETCMRLDAAQQTPDGPNGTQIALGDPALDTIGLYMMRLKEGVATAPNRTTANNILAVAKGRGTTIVEGKKFTWERGDVIAVPMWQQHSHVASEESVLLRVTDEPTMSRLGFLRNAQFAPPSRA